MGFKKRLIKFDQSDNLMHCQKQRKYTYLRSFTKPTDISRILLHITRYLHRIKQMRTQNTFIVTFANFLAQLLGSSKILDFCQ